MDAWGSSPTNFVAVSLLFLLPYIFFFRNSVLPTTPKLPKPKTLLRPFLTLLVIVHTLYTLRRLLCKYLSSNQQRTVNLNSTSLFSAAG